MKLFINIPFITFILQGIPEQIAVTTLAFIIANLPIRWNRIILTGSVLAFSAYLVRLLPIPFGIHTIVLILLLFLFLTNLGADFSLSLIASLISFLALIIFEIICVSLLMPVFGVQTETLLTDPIIRVLISVPQVVLVFVSAFLVRKYLGRGNS